MLIGKTYSGTEVIWDIGKKHNYNNFACATGKSGSGKTTTMRRIVKDAANNGIACLIIDYSGSYYKKEIEKLYGPMNYINIELEGLGVKPFLTRVRKVEGQAVKETMDAKVSRIADILCAGYRITGSKQKSKLRGAIYIAMIDYGIDGTFRDVYNSIKDKELSERFFGLNSPSMSKGSINWADMLKPGTINVIQLSDTYEYNKSVCTECLLADLWNATQQNLTGGYLLCLDEIQRLSFRPDSTMSQMLRESRKYSVAMLLATQFISNRNPDMRELLEQSAIRFYFKPSDKDLVSVAKAIDNINYRKWIPKLQSLQVGEFVFTGNALINNEARDVKVIIPEDKLPVF